MVVFGHKLMKISIQDKDIFTFFFQQHKIWQGEKLAPLYLHAADIF